MTLSVHICLHLAVMLQVSDNADACCACFTLSNVVDILLVKTHIFSAVRYSSNLYHA